MSRVRDRVEKLKWAAYSARDAWQDGGLRELESKTRGWWAKRGSAGQWPPVGETATWWRGGVLMIAGFDPPQCWHYRVQQKVEACQAAGIPMRVVQPHHLDELIAALQVASLLIVYRQPMNIHLPNIIAEAHRLGIPVVYEADDIVYRTDLVAANPNLATLPADLREAVIKGAADYEAALRACDAVLASTAPLAADMERFVAGPAAVVDNGIDAIMSSMARGIEVDRAAGRLRSPGVDDGQVVIAYGSGSRAHDLDLAVAAAPLAAVLAAHGHVRLRLIGPLALPSELAPFADRIERMELLPEGEYLRELAQCDISIAPLADVGFNHYKSQVKYLEAGLVGLAFVASEVVYGTYVQDGRTGFIARDAEQWRGALERLVTDAELRREVGEAARADVQRWQVGTNGAEQMRAMLEVFGVQVSG
ncbi:MAG: glycosyltransferase [Actinobacteria bacterium]|nr:MAG: glycosyltransferase [Actinomycetota bacterium]